MQFRDLAIGAEFRFASENDPKYRHSGMARGPWRKISARKYVAIANPAIEHRVGTINVEVSQ